MNQGTHKRRILLTKDAVEAYRRFESESESCVNSGGLSNPQSSRLEAVKQFIKQTATGDPFTPDRALSGPLSMIFVVTAGPLRVYYTRRQSADIVLVLYFSESTSNEEAYKTLLKMAGSERFDCIFKELGLVPPDRSQQLDSPPIQ